MKRETKAVLREREISRRAKIKPNPSFISSESEIMVSPPKAPILVSNVLFVGR